MKLIFSDEKRYLLTIDGVPTPLDVTDAFNDYISDNAFMTGQEFYDKFDTEMSKVSDTWRDGGNGFNEVRVVRRAAKQAAGLEL